MTRVVREGTHKMLLQDVHDPERGSTRVRWIRTGERPQPQCAPVRPIEDRRPTDVDPRKYDRRTALSL